MRIDERATVYMLSLTAHMLKKPTSGLRKHIQEILGTRDSMCQFCSEAGGAIDVQKEQFDHRV